MLLYPQIPVDLYTKISDQTWEFLKLECDLPEGMGIFAAQNFKKGPFYATMGVKFILAWTQLFWIASKMKTSTLLKSCFWVKKLTSTMVKGSPLPGVNSSIILANILISGPKYLSILRRCQKSCLWPKVTLQLEPSLCTHMEANLEI